MFGTLQDRLIKQLAKQGCREIDAANAWIREVYLPAHNARFARPAGVPESAFVAVHDPATLVETLCVQDKPQTHVRDIPPAAEIRGDPGGLARAGEPDAARVRIVYLLLLTMAPVAPRPLKPNRTTSERLK